MDNWPDSLFVIRVLREEYGGGQLEEGQVENSRALDEILIRR